MYRVWLIMRISLVSSVRASQYLFQIIIIFIECQIKHNFHIQIIMEQLHKYFSLTTRLLQRVLDWSVPYRKIRWMILSSLTFHVLYRIFVYDYLAILFFWGLYFLYLIVQYFTPSGLPDPDEDDSFLVSRKDKPDIQFRVEQINSDQMHHLFQDREFKEYLEEVRQNQQDHTQERPLLRTITEFTLWKNTMGTLLISWLCTYSDIFLIPVYWPFLLIYFIWLIGLAIHKHIRHMRKYGYKPGDFLVDKQKQTEKQQFFF